MGRKKGKGGRRWKRQAAASALYKNETEKKIKREINEKMKKKIEGLLWIFYPFLRIWMKKLFSTE